MTKQHNKEKPKEVYEHLSKHSIILWEMLCVLVFGLVFIAMHLVLPRYHISRYIGLFVVGAAFVMLAFLYLPLMYLSVEYCVSKHHILLKRGVFVAKYSVIRFENITYFTLYKTPFEKVIPLGAVLLYSPGVRMGIFFLHITKAKAIVEKLQRYMKIQ